MFCIKEMLTYIETDVSVFDNCFLHVIKHMFCVV